MYQAFPMLTSKDRFVTPTITIPHRLKALSFVVPTLDDAADITLEVAPLPHRFNYPYPGPDFASGGVVLEFDMDDEDGTTIVDTVHNLVLTEQGDPTFAASAGAAGLGKKITLDGTGDAFDCLVTAVPDAALITTGDFSLELVFIGTNASVGAGDTLACCRTGAAGVGWQVQADANQHLDFHIEDADAETASEDGTDIATDAAVCIHITADRDGNAITYTNGASDKVTDISAAEKTIRPAAGAANRFALGGDAARTAGDCWYGDLIFFRLYNRALSAAQVLDNYNVLMGTGRYPGWSPVTDPTDGAPFVVNASGNAPGTTVAPEWLVRQLQGHAFRMKASVEQTTTPVELEFGVIYN